MRNLNLINERNLSEDLKIKLNGYKSNISKNFTDIVNASISDLRNTKQDKSDMSKYFNRTTEKIQKSEIDPRYTKILDDHMASKIDFNKLDDSVKNRIVTYENVAAVANNKADILRNEVNGLNTFETYARTEITTLFDLIKNLETGGSSGSSTISPSDITKLQNEIILVDQKVDTLSSTPANVSDIKYSQLSNDLQKMIIEKAAVEIDQLTVKNSGIGMITTTGGDEVDKDGNHVTGVLHPAYIMLYGIIARTEADRNSAIANGAEQIFCEFDKSYIIRNDVVESFMKDYITTSYDANYKKLDNALTGSWICNNKFLYDIETGEMVFNSYGNLINISPHILSKDVMIDADSSYDFIIKSPFVNIKKILIRDSNGTYIDANVAVSAEYSDSHCMLTNYTDETVSVRIYYAETN